MGHWLEDRFRGLDRGEVSRIVARLEAGEPPSLAGDQERLDSLGLIAAVALDALGADHAGGPPLTRGRPPRPGLRAALGEAGLPALVPGLGRPARLALAAGLLQIHDFWEDSHQAAQEADDLGETSVSAYWHGVAHRREPDPGNASYWFRRVGRHPVFLALAERAGQLLGPPEASRLIPRGAWDPFAFIAMCSQPRNDAALLRGLQRTEMILLLEASLPG